MSNTSAVEGRWTRRRLLCAAATGSAVAAGGAAIGAHAGDGISLAAPSPSTDADILNLFLLLERLQEAFYRAALERGGLDGKLLAYANAVVGQERDHVAFLARRLGSRAKAPPRTSGFQDALSSPSSFRDAAIELEEAALGAYIGEGANLSRSTVAAVAVLVSVEARQAAWVRDIAGVSPAPRAADPARRPGDVLADLRRKGWLR